MIDRPNRGLPYYSNRSMGLNEGGGVFADPLDAAGQGFAIA